MPAALNGHSCQFVQKRVALQTVSHLRNGLDDIRVTAHCLLRPWAVHKQDFFGKRPRTGRRLFRSPRRLREETGVGSRRVGRPLHNVCCTFATQPTHPPDAVRSRACGALVTADSALVTADKSGMKTGPAGFGLAVASTGKLVESGECSGCVSTPYETRTRLPKATAQKKGGKLVEQSAS